MLPSRANFSVLKSALDLIKARMKFCLVRERRKDQRKGYFNHLPDQEIRAHVLVDKNYLKLNIITTHL